MQAATNPEVRRVCGAAYGSQCRSGITARGHCSIARGAPTLGAKAGWLIVAASDACTKSQHYLVDPMSLPSAEQGWNLLGNLLDLGKLAFSPASPEVLKFTAYMEGRYGSFFTDNFHGVFATEVRVQHCMIFSAPCNP